MAKIGDIFYDVSANTAPIEAQLRALQARINALSGTVKPINIPVNTAGLGAASKGVTGLGNAAQKATPQVRALQSGLLSLGFAANNSVAGTALLTAGFSAAENSTASFLRTLGTIGPIIGFTAAIAGAAQQVATLEQAQIDVTKVTTLNQEEIGVLTIELQGLSRQLGISTQDLLGTAGAAGRLGVDGLANIEAFTETISKLSIATDVVGEQGAESLAKFLAQTGTANAELGSVAQELGDVLNELGNNLPTTAGRVLEFTRFTGQLGSFAGVTREEILGLSAGLDSLGIRAEGAGNPLAALFADIQKNAREGSSELALYAELAGTTTDAFAELAATDIDDAFQLLAEGLSEAREEGENVQQKIDALGVTQQRQFRILNILSQGYETYADAIALATDELATQGSVDREVARVTESLIVQVRALGQDFAVLFQNLGQDLLPLLKGSVGVLRALIGGFSDLNPAVRTLVTSLGLLAPLLGSLFGPAGLIAAGVISIGLLIPKIRGLSKDSKDFADAVEDSATKVSEFADTSRSVADELDKLSKAQGEEGLTGAARGLAQFLDGPAKQAFIAYTNEIITSADTTTNKVAQIFNKFREFRAQFLRSQIRAAEVEQNEARVNLERTVAQVVRRSATGDVAGSAEIDAITKEQERLTKTLEANRAEQEKIALNIENIGNAIREGTGGLGNVFDGLNEAYEELDQKNTELNASQIELNASLLEAEANTPIKSYERAAEQVNLLNSSLDILRKELELQESAEPLEEVNTELRTLVGESSNATNEVEKTNEAVSRLGSSSSGASETPKRSPKD